MRIIKPDVKIWEQGNTLEEIYKHIEICGRICYASDPIEGKAKDFVDRMIRLGHGSVLEHGTIYLIKNTINIDEKSVDYPKSVAKYINNKYSKVNFINNHDRAVYITTNYRVIMQGDYKTWDEAMSNNFNKNWLDDLEYLCKPTKYHELRKTIHFTTQIAITREFNRHRVNSVSEQSTRYCNYSKDKFGGVGINLPTNISDSNLQYILNTCNEESSLSKYCEVIADNDCNTPYIGMKAVDYWLFANLACEFSYFNLLRLGWLPQQARVILPLDTNTEIVHTAFISDWEHFLVLRNHKNVHPDASYLASKIAASIIA